jgi:hypothetical protein
LTGRLTEIVEQQSLATPSANDQAVLARHLLTHCWDDRRHTITGLLCCAGRLEQDWSADYRLYSHDIDARKLFAPIIERACRMTAPDEPIILCVDDSLMKKTGRKIKQAGYYRDPLGPAFHTNLIYALRFVQMSIGVSDPNYRRGYRTIPVAGSIIVKPPKDATEEERTDHSPSTCAIQLLGEVRRTLAETESKQKVVLCGDSHYTTSTLLRQLPEDVTYIGRFQKNAALYAPYHTSVKGRGRPRAYGQQLPTPEALRKDTSVPWEAVKIRRAGGTIKVNYKRYAEAKWKPAGEKKTVQVVVVRPLRRGRDSRGRMKYTQPAFLLCTDPEMPIAKLLQVYLVRWGIEVNFREEKQLFGIGEAQLRKGRRVLAAPLVAIAAYSALLMAGREEYADGKKPAHLRTGRWQRRWKHTSYRTSDLRRQLYSEAAMLGMGSELKCVANPTNKTGFCKRSP